MKKDETLLQEYDSNFKAQSEAGIIELVPKDEEDFEGAHFLPNCEVLREDCLEKGPNLTPHVFEVLAKFRSHPLGLTADIEKAFHQILANPADPDQLRFLWFKTVKKERPEIVQYRFRRVLF